jgi:redox-sensitive bicupin YhaK (pirin superfamily)
MPEGHTALMVVQSGSLTANGQALKAVELASFDRKGEVVALRAEAASRVLVLSGQPLNEPVVGQGPFVMNSRDEIQQAMVDYQAGRMGRL